MKQNQQVQCRYTHHFTITNNFQTLKLWIISCYFCAICKPKKIIRHKYSKSIEWTLSCIKMLPHNQPCTHIPSNDLFLFIHFFNYLYQEICWLKLCGMQESNLRLSLFLYLRVSKRETDHSTHLVTQIPGIEQLQIVLSYST